MGYTKLRIVCVSDTVSSQAHLRSAETNRLTAFSQHHYRPGEGFALPQGDVLIHAGDFTNQGSFHEVKRAIDWISAADYAVKIVVAGKIVESNTFEETYLPDESVRKP